MTSSAIRRVAAELGVAPSDAFKVIAEGDGLAAYEEAHPEIDSPKIPFVQAVQPDPPPKAPTKPRRRRRPSTKRRSQKQT